MTKFSTALLMVGPAQVGIFGDDLWRVSSASQLVEGGSNGPFWLTPVSGDSGKDETALLIDGTEPCLLRDSIVILGAIASKDEQAIGILRDTHNIVEDDFGIHVAPYWELAPSTRQNLIRQISQKVRFGFVILAQDSILDSRFFESLTLSGLTCEVFSRTPSLSSNFVSGATPPPRSSPNQ